MPSKFTEIMDPSNPPTYTHPHLNVSLEDVIAEDSRKHSSSSSDGAGSRSGSRSASHGSATSGSGSGSGSSDEERKDTLRRRISMFGRRRTGEKKE